MFPVIRWKRPADMLINPDSNGFREWRVPMDEMKKCIQCGADLPGDALFCPECGARQAAPAAPDAASKSMAAGSTASYDPFAAKDAPPSPGPSNPVQPPPPSPFQPAPAYKPQPAAAAPQPPPAAGFQYAAPKAQQGAPNPYAPQQGMQGAAQQPYPPQQGMQGGGQQPYPPQSGPMNAPIKPLVKQGRNIPIFLLVVSVILAAGLGFWLLNFLNPDLVYSFGDDTSKGVVFALILMTVLSLVNAGVLRYQLRGKKMAILANVLLVLIAVVLLFGISMTEFVDGDLPYNLFIKLVP
jgi:hypothetical protein